MKAAVTTRAGSPSVLEIQEVPMPARKEGWILIRVKAFGLNRSELFTRKGDSTGVKFPRIQGIECVGLVEEDPSGNYSKGQQVVAIMGDGGTQMNIQELGTIMQFKPNVKILYVYCDSLEFIHHIVVCNRYNT